MNSKLITHLSWKRLLTKFNGAYEDFSVSTHKTQFWSSTFNTTVNYNLLNFDPESEGDYVVLSIQSNSLMEALANHIALSKLVSKEEPINWNEHLIEENKPKYLSKPKKTQPHQLFTSFKSDYSKAILAINSMNPTEK